MKKKKPPEERPSMTERANNLETVEKEQAVNISLSLLTRMFLHCFYKFQPVNHSGVNIFI